MAGIVKSIRRKSTRDITGMNATRPLASGMAGRGGESVTDILRRTRYVSGAARPVS